MRNRIIRVLITIFVFVFVFYTTAYAVEYAGQIKIPNTYYPNEEYLDWSLDSDTGNLTISGIGEMPDYSSGGSAPYTGNINGVYVGPLATNLHVEEGVTRIGNYAFTCQGMKPTSNIATAFIASTVNSIGKNALNITNLKEVYIFGEDVSFGESAISKSATIFGYAGTSVEQYAINNNIRFVALCRVHTELLINTVEATCTTEGYTGDVVCTVCGATITIGEVVPALGHNYVLINKQSATCTEEGYSGDTVCSRCNEIKENGSIVPALGHKLGSWQISQSPECEKDGTKIRFCDRCNYQEVETIAKLGHDYGEWTIEKQATCTENGEEVRICSRDKNHIEKRDFNAIGHDWGEWIVTKEANCINKGEKTRVCRRDSSHIETIYIDLADHTPGDAVIEHGSKPTCTTKGFDEEVIYCSICKSELSKKTIWIDALGHNFIDGVCTRCGEKKSDYVYPTVSDVTRYYGNTRYETAIKVANAFKTKLGVDKFDTVILACGTNFADALAGSYLSTVKNAPIILVDSRQDHINLVQNYIKNNLASNGTIYILGGVAVVPDKAVEGLEYNINRLWGYDRYETNVKILQEAGATGDEILVANGTSFADSLSASATGKPILLVKNTIQPSQKEYVKSLKGKKFFIIGGNGAVNSDIEAYFKTLGTTERLGGLTRYDTSVNVAKAFFESPKGAVLAYGANFPDGLCGGSLANAMGGPLLLAKNGKAEAAAIYAKEAGINGGVVLGGPTLIDDANTRKIFRMPADSMIL